MQHDLDPTTSRHRWWRLSVVATVLVAAIVTSTSPPAAALTTITVTTSADSGAGSLRQAFADASSLGPAAGDDVEIVIPSTVGDIVLTTGELVYDGGDTAARDITLRGSGQTISQSSTIERVIRSDTNGLTTIEHLTIADGSASLGQFGGGIKAQASITLRDAVVTGNEALSFEGGGIFADGDVTLIRSVISGNTAPGAGGFAAMGDATVIDSVVEDNTAASSTGGGLRAEGDVTVIGSTISGNTSDGPGGGIHATGIAEVTNSTITDNAATSGGGIWSDGAMSLRFTTIVANTAPTGANAMPLSPSTSFASVLTNPQGGGENCDGSPLGSDGWNVADDDSCAFTATGDLQGTGVDPLLGPLGDNGGATATMVPLEGSPLLDAIPLASCDPAITLDQRGLPRPSGDGCDVGAVEVQVAAPAPPAGPGDGGASTDGGDGSGTGGPGAAPPAPATPTARAAAAEPTYTG